MTGLLQHTRALAKFWQSDHKQEGIQLEKCQNRAISGSNRRLTEVVTPLTRFIPHVSVALSSSNELEQCEEIFGEYLMLTL